MFNSGLPDRVGWKLPGRLAKSANVYRKLGIAGVAGV